jgi:ProP effector
MSSTSPAPAPSSADLPTGLPAEPPVVERDASLAQAAAETAVTPETAAPGTEAVADVSADLGDDAPVRQPAPAADPGADAGPDAAPTESGTAKDASQQASPAATAAKLAELFPALFKGAPKPLKLRIQVDIQERAPGVFSKQALSAFFRRHTGATSYLIAVSKGAQRFDLDGQPAGELSEEHRQVATEELARRRANANAKREQEEAGRRERASLLRDIETTKLTTANFCALKGIAPDQLDGLLAQARAEALEDAQRPRRPEYGPRQGEARRGEGGGGRRDAGNGPGRGPGGPNNPNRGPRHAPRGGPGPGHAPRPDQRGPRPQQAQARGGDKAEGGQPARPQEGSQERPQEGAPAGEGRKDGRPPRRD